MCGVSVSLVLSVLLKFKKVQQLIELFGKQTQVDKLTMVFKQPVKHGAKYTQVILRIQFNSFIHLSSEHF